VIARADDVASSHALFVQAAEIANPICNGLASLASETRDLTARDRLDFR